MPPLPILGIGALLALVLVWWVAHCRGFQTGSLQQRYERALWLTQNGRHEEAIAVLEAISDEAAARGGIRARTVAANAMLQRAVALDAIGRSSEAARLCVDIEGEYGGDGDSGMQLAVGRALLLRAHLARMERPTGKPDERESLTEELNNLVDRNGASPDPAMRRVVAEARIITAARLGEGGDTAAGLAILDELVATAGRRLGSQADRVVSAALAEKGSLLEGAGDYEAALAAYRASRDRTNLDGSLRLLGQAGGLVHEARVLRALGRPAEAIAAYDEILSLVVANQQPARRYVIEAAKGKANTLWKLGQRSEAVQALDHLVELARQWGDTGLRTETQKAREWMARHIEGPYDEGPS
jgi:tetratricopeptide (TPR) repeat protein